MTYPTTLLQALHQHPSPDAAIHFIRSEQDTFTLSYAELSSRASGLLHYFQQSGVQQGDQVILITQRNEAFLEGFWAAITGGVTAVPLSFGISDEHKWKLFRIIHQLSRPWIVLDQAHLLRLEKFAAAHQLEKEWAQLQPRLFVIEQIPKFSGQGVPAAVSPDDTAFIQFSSGTTSDPKGVVLTHKNLLSNISGIISGMKMTAADTTLSWMPLTHDMGLIGFHLTPLVYGISQYIMPTEVFIRRPALWLEKISHEKATVTCSPNFGYKHCLKALDAEKIARLDLSCIRLIFNGAEPIAVPLIDQFMLTLAPAGLKPGSMFTVYGLAEASLAVAFPEAEKGYRAVTLSRESLSPGKKAVEDSAGLPFVIEGRAIAGCRIRITGEDGNILPDGHIGQIEISGENVTAGYLNQPELNSRVIREGWLNTGDLGLLNAAQELIVTGRAKDIIFINGQNYYPHDIELIAEEKTGIEKGKVAACGIRNAEDTEDQLILFVLHKGAVSSFFAQIPVLKQVIGEEAGIQVTAVVPVARIPKTTSGKIQRYLLGAQYTEGEFNPVLEEIRTHFAAAESPVDRTAGGVERSLLELYTELIPGHNVRPEDNIFEIGTSSLLLAQLHQRIEEAYPGTLEVTDFFDYPTIRELAGFISSKHQA